MNLDKLREFCLSFPGATEGVKWEDHICFMVAEKIFCMTGSGGGITFKILPEEFEELTERDGIVPTPYMARNMWVTVYNSSALKPGEWKHYITQSYELVRAKLPKRVQSELK
jgi:predicted DNA-binding protein (MmcQ/YjbR family)